MTKILSILTLSGLSQSTTELLQSLALLVLRLAFGGMMLVGHGWGKLMSFGEKNETFPDPLGIGSPLSMTLAVGAEVFCAAAIVIGFATRWAALPLIITMLVAAGIIHAEDPWQRKEFALLYLFPFLTLALAGPGRFSADHYLAAHTRTA